MIFKSKIYQNNGIIDATDLFRDLETTIAEQKLIHGDSLGRKNPLQHILNSTSGKYIAPTSMKSFDMCPGSYLYSKLVPELVGTATSVGRSYHTIMERWYNGEERTEETIYKIMEEVILEDDQEEKREELKIYIKGYLESPDYINNQKMDHQNLNCYNEVFIKPIIRPLGVDLNVPVYTLIDRIDLRDDGLYITDYKTGMGDPNPFLLGEHGYLPQMIFYKWAVEAEYGEEVKKVFLGLPGASLPFKYTEMNVNSLVEQSKVIEQVHNHLQYIQGIRESKQFPTKRMRYCNSCRFKSICQTFIKTKGLDESNIKQEIDVEIEVLDKIYTEEDK